MYRIDIRGFARVEDFDPKEICRHKCKQCESVYLRLSVILSGFKPPFFTNSKAPPLTIEQEGKDHRYSNDFRAFRAIFKGDCHVRGVTSDNNSRCVITGFGCNGESLTLEEMVALGAFGNALRIPFSRHLPSNQKVDPQKNYKARHFGDPEIHPGKLAANEMLIRGVSKEEILNSSDLTESEIDDFLAGGEFFSLNSLNQVYKVLWLEKAKIEEKKEMDMEKKILNELEGKTIDFWPLMPAIHPGNIIAEMIEYAQSTREGFAKAVHISPERLEEILQEKAMPSEDELKCIGNHLGIDPDVLGNYKKIYIAKLNNLPQPI